MTSLSSPLPIERNPTLSPSTTACGTTSSMTETQMLSISDHTSPMSTTTIPKKRSPNPIPQPQSKKATISTKPSATHQLIQQHEAQRPHTINPIPLTPSLLTPTLPSFQDNCIALTILRRNNPGLPIPCSPPLPLLQQLLQQPQLLHQPQTPILHSELLMQCNKPSIVYQWGPEEKEEEILSILWVEEALLHQEEETGRPWRTWRRSTGHAAHASGRNPTCCRCTSYGN